MFFIDLFIFLTTMKWAAPISGSCCFLSKRVCARSCLPLPECACAWLNGQAIGDDAGDLETCAFGKLSV